MLTTIFVVFALFSGCQGLRVSADLENGATLYVCEGQDLTLPWNIQLDSGERIGDVTWFFDDEMIAVFLRNRFFPTPSYSERVNHVTGGVIRLSNVTNNDAGNYTIKVNVHDAGSDHVTEERSATLHVASESSAREDATMEVAQSPRAVYSTETNRYHVQLTCSSRGHQPHSVVWETPSKKVKRSSDRDGEAFSWLLPNPVSSGLYTCRIPSDSPAAKCLPKKSRVLKGASLFIDKTETRLMLLEARQEAVRRENDMLKAENSELKNEINEMKQQIGSLKGPAVSFFAQFSDYKHPAGQANIVLKFDDVKSNVGGAYDPQSGKFTAPVDGTYAFFLNLLMHPDGTETNFCIYANEREVALTTLARTSNLNVVLELKAGDKVFAFRRDGTARLMYGINHTTFSGTLIRQK